MKGQTLFNIMHSKDHTSKHVMPINTHTFTFMYQVFKSVSIRDIFVFTVDSRLFEPPRGIEI